MLSVLWSLKLNPLTRARSTPKPCRPNRLHKRPPSAQELMQRMQERQELLKDTQLEVHKPTKAHCKGCHSGCQWDWTAEGLRC